MPRIYLDRKWKLKGEKVRVRLPHINAESCEAEKYHCAATSSKRANGYFRKKAIDLRERVILAQEKRRGTVIFKQDFPD